MGGAIWAPPTPSAKQRGCSPPPLYSPGEQLVNWLLVRWKQAWAEARGSLIALLRYARTSLSPTAYDLKLKTSLKSNKNEY